MKIMLFLGIIAIAVLLVYLVTMTIDRYALKRKLNALDNPVLFLPKKEQRAYAREQLEREQERYDLALQRAIVEQLQAETSPRKGLFE